MELKNKNITLTTNNCGEISSIKYKGKETLHQGEQWWKKTFPVIWPNLSFSDGFEVNGKNYKLPKHGFWNTLEWESFFENEELVMTATHVANDVFPFTMDIQQFIAVKDSSVNIQTVISNLSKETAYFQFGLHPAFKIDESSVFTSDTKQKPFALDMEGKMTNKTVDISGKIIDIPYSEWFDTLVYKDVDTDSITIENKDLSIKFTHDSNNLQIWKPREAMFVCVEPWYGVNDREDTLIKEAAKKKEIISLKSGKKWISNFLIEYR